MKQLSSYEPWPALPYQAFQSTAHLIHMGAQVIGKLKLQTPFESHWNNVPLWLTSCGLTTGPIPYQSGTFSIDMDFISHKIIGTSSWGAAGEFSLRSMSVAKLTEKIFKLLHRLQISLNINMMPQEIANPIAFDKDTTPREYNKSLANAWWRILLSSYRVLQSYHAHFSGITPAIGFMWGTFDLRDVRFNGIAVPADGMDYIRRNAMDEAQIEMGWWHGTDAYPHPAYYSFTYPKPDNIENVRIQPEKAHWDDSMGEFLLDYDVIRRSKNPEKDLFAFFESTYQVGAAKAHWDSKFTTSGRPN